MDKNGNLAWTTFGRYALLEKIGSGGMAEIYRAKTFGAAGFEKEFAVKMILPSLADDKEFVGMFINEAKISVSLYHANIVQVFDLGELDAQYYIAMEFVHGKDLLDVLARCAQLDLKIPFNLVLHVTMEFLKGLDFAHRARNTYGEDLNIIHRDVSPSNVLISYSGDVKIGDFGVAKAQVQRNTTESGTLKGKVGYMSPEQVIGEEIDARSDVFSAGIVFFEALAMQRLFVGNSDLDVMLKVRDAAIDDAIRAAGPMPNQLEDIVRKALAKHREERYQSAGEFYQALMDFCYSHRIKVTGADLSNFMRRLFASDIEREKSKRLNEERDNSRQRAAVLAAERQRIETPIPLQASWEPPPPLPEIRPAFVGKPPAEVLKRVDTDDLEDLMTDSDATNKAVKYRYRDEAGLVFGPMGAKTLARIVTDRAPEPGDRISADGGPWQEPAAFEFLSNLTQAPAPGGASKSVPVGAGVYRPTKRPPVDVVEDSAAEIGAESSPVLSHSPAVVTPPNDQAKEVIERLREQYASYEGDLARTPFPQILARLHRTKATGRLFVRRDDVEKSIYFDHGEPILVDSNRAEELLGFFLISRRIISQAQLEDGLARLSEWGGRLGDALVAIGAIPAHEIFRHLSDQMREKILDVFTWETGTFGYFENQQPDTHGYPLGLDAYNVIVDGCLNHLSAPRVAALCQRHAQALLQSHTDTVPLDRLKLSSKALRVVNAFEDGATVAEILAKFPAEDRPYAQRVIVLLVYVEHISVANYVVPNLPA